MTWTATNPVTVGNPTKKSDFDKVWDNVMMLLTQHNTDGTHKGFIKLRDEKTQNTAGGGFTSGSWATRTLNTEVFDTNGDCTLASNQITLAAGTYLIVASAPGFSVQNHQIRLQNVTDGTTILTGTSEITATGTNDQSRSWIIDKFTIGAGKALEIQHWCTATKSTNGLGYPANITTEVYTEVFLWRLE